VLEVNVDLKLLRDFRWIDGLRILVLAGLYFGGARISLAFSMFDGYVTLVWPPTGIALAAVLIYGNRMGLGILLGGCLSAAFNNHAPIFMLGQTVASLSEAYVAVWLLKHRLDFDLALNRLRDVTGLLFHGALLSTAVSALVGTLSLTAFGLIHWQQFWKATLLWWMGDALSVLVITPLLLSLKSGPIRWSWLREGEVAILCAFLVGMTLSVFFGWQPEETSFHPKAFVLFPVLVWAAFSFRLRGAAMATFFVTAMGLWAAANGLGDFAEDFSRTNIINFWLYVAIIASTNLMLCAVYSSRRLSEGKLKEQFELYNSLIQAQSDVGEGVLVVENGKIIHANQAMSNISGYTLEEMRSFGSFLDLLQPGERERVGQRYQKRLRGEAVENRYEVLGLHRDGRSVYLEIAVSLMPKEDDSVRMTIVVHDITVRKQAEAKLLLAHQIFTHTAEGILITDADQRILEANHGFEEITGYQRDEVLGQTLQMFESSQHDRAFYDAMWREIDQKGQWQGEIWNRRKNGEIFPEWLSISEVKDDTGAVTNYVGVFTDITMRKESEQRLHFLANHDALTKLPNRILLQERIEHALRLAQRNRSQLAVLFIDLDRFKVINDTLGHHVGDVLLLEVSGRLLGCLRESDTIARQGGDEFVVLLEEFGEDVQYLAAVARKIMASLIQPFTLMGQEIFISASIGISVYPQDGQDMSSLLKNADIAMYRAKEQGKNTFQFYASEANVHSFERLSMENSLRKALERKEFVLYYQPKIDLESDAIVGAEALVRWNHPDLGMVPPDQFIPLAEETGVIVPIGEWVLREACFQNRAWQKAGLPSITVAVNLSAGQFRDESLRSIIASALVESGLPPSCLELEITESMIMHNPERAAAILHSFRDMGMHTSIDDFGTGYSSLGYLKRFPVNTLKVDRSFVRDVPGDADDVAITKAIIALAHSLNLKVVAEGVETKTQLDFLRSQRCDQIQGYIYSAPVTAEEFAKLLKTAPFSKA
jgi:diguanylate cyclase (GGDEF)-like protein/PAS domain S-box-containing protein